MGREKHNGHHAGSVCLFVEWLSTEDLLCNATPVGNHLPTRNLAVTPVYSQGPQDIRLHLRPHFPALYHLRGGPRSRISVGSNHFQLTSPLEEAHTL